jgi:diguanylate cyclase (GGDEF)-like protein
MASAKSKIPSFAIKVLTPSVMAVTSIALLLLYVVNGIFVETNKLDEKHAEKLAKAAIGSVREHLETVVSDNAIWDDAAQYAGSQNVDTAWLNATWGVSSAFDTYNAVYVVSLDGKTLYAARDGVATQDTATAYFGSDIGKLLKRAANSGKPESGLLRTADGVSTVAASRIAHATDRGIGRPPASNILIIAEPLDERAFNRLSRHYAMENLRLIDADMQSPGGTVGVMSLAGEELGRLTWTNLNPGDIVRAKYSYVVTMLVIMFLFMVAVLLYTSWKGFKEAKESQDEAVAASLRDDLTGLANRREMLAALSRHLTLARKNGAGLSVIYADLDGFKEVNDSYGHEIGDMLLKATAGGFAYLAKDAEVVARLGGDEFAIILTGPGSAERARVTAQRMIEFLVEPMIFDGRIASVTVSVGIVDFENDDTDVEEIIRRADVAMYAAKSQGRNCVYVYQKSLDYKRDESRAIAQELRSYIDRQKLTVVYQPIVDARTRRTKGVEALVRWPKDAPTRYTPDVFIPVAEEFGLIEDLGLFVLKEACRQAAQWDDIFVSVNVSPIQFMNPAFADLVASTLAITGLDAKRLEIEVTEGFIIDNAARANNIINCLHDMHVRVALDDFGTGFSSIGHLRRFKFDKLKLDRSMVSDILRQPSALRLVQGTIAMADALGLTVVAEGIEDENQVSVLRLAGCSQFQGYLFSRPVEAGEITAFLDDGRRAIAI